MTAWGVAGLSTPWIGGWLFDLTGEYMLVSVIGLAVAAAGIVVTFFIKDHRPAEPPAIRHWPDSVARLPRACRTRRRHGS